MMVLVEALEPFVTILGSGDMISAVRGEKVSVPKDRADKLVAVGYAKVVEAPKPPAPPAKPEPPANKSAGNSPEVKTPQKRQPAKSPKGE